MNGPPGIGKSTLARRYVDEHPLALCLEQDVIRGLLGGWVTRETESGQHARELCLVMAREHLATGKDVVVPQFVAMPEYLDRLADVAARAGASYVECVLLDEPGAAERRFHDRIHDPLWAAHQRVASKSVEEAGGFRNQYDRLTRALKGREVTVVDSIEGDVDATYAELLTHLDG